MSEVIVWSADYHYPRGDLVLQDMFRSASSNGEEGESDGCPLKISQDLCSAESFTVLCALLYPKKIGVLPPVLVSELDIWAPALKATQALQMDGAREYILSQFEVDRMNIPAVAARLLGIIINYEETSDTLKLECIHSLIIRRGPILALEAHMLGSDTMAHISTIRDRVRTLAASRSSDISDEHPVVIPSDLCSAETFDTICQFLYPRAIGAYPAILIDEQEKWEFVLQATSLLQMKDLRKYILANFKGELRDNPTVASKLLGLAVKYNEAPNTLKLECLYVLVFLRRAISATEITSLGENATFQVVAIRDRIRILILTDPSYWTTIHRHHFCIGGPNCQNFIHQGVFNNLKETDPLQEYYRTDASIFELPEDVQICPNCNPVRSDLAATIAQEVLKEEIKRCATGLGLLHASE
ncbi:hypothetical protein RhiTH_007947 [Rhizoctonia solani]